jgi:ATP-dependent Clp protease, protease subunit
MANYKTDMQYKDIGTILLENRIINLVGEVNDGMAYQIVSALLVLDEQNSKPIQLFINSPGGSVHAGLAIIDAMKFIKAPVYTYCVGLAASMGAAILAAGEKGHRYAMPNATVMLHQVSGGSEGNIQDQRVSLAYSERLNKKLMKIIANNVNKTFEQLEKDTLRDKWMFADEAKDYGVIDEVVTAPEKEKTK